MDTGAVLANYLCSIRMHFDGEKQKQIDRVIYTLEDGTDLARVVPQIRGLLRERGELIEQLNALLPPCYEEAQGKLQEALEFIGQVEARYYREKPEVYQSFLRILGDFHRERVDAETVIEEVRELLRGEARLVEGFEYLAGCGVD